MCVTRNTLPLEWPVSLPSLTMGVVTTAPLASTLVPVPVDDHVEALTAAAFSSSEDLPGSFVLEVLGGVLVTGMALVLLAAVSYQCTATWRWLKSHALDIDGSSEDALAQQAAIRISHSLPDLKAEPTRKEYVQDTKEVGNKKVLRQTTLPSVPTRHQTFQRQLSHRLDLQPIQFSVCSLEPKADSILGLIKPELYQKEGLMRQASSDSSGTGEMEYCGKLHFALKYDEEIEGLVVKVLESRDLPIKDVMGSSDPYVKVHLLPDRKKKFQTKVIRKNLNPVFNETFIFSVAYEELRHRCLQFSVYDFDRFSRHDLIGQVVLKGLLDFTDLLQEIEYTMNILCAPQAKNLSRQASVLTYLLKCEQNRVQTSSELINKMIAELEDHIAERNALVEEKTALLEKVKDLETKLEHSHEDFQLFTTKHNATKKKCSIMERELKEAREELTKLREEKKRTTKQDKVDLGELMLSLCYLPTAGRLTATIIKGRNLKAMDITGSSDPYVKVYLLCEGKRIKKKKTTVKKSTLHPVYNEALVFDVPADNVEDVSLIVKVIDYDRIGPNELMGCTAVGSSFIGIGRDHWLEMLDNPRKPVAQWYPLLESVPGQIPLTTSQALPASLSCLNGR